MSKKDFLVGLKMFSATTGAEGREGEEWGAKELVDEEFDKSAARRRR